METKEWYDDLFLSEIFEIDDKKIDEYDIKKIELIYKKNKNFSYIIISESITRFDTSRFLNFNIENFIDIIKKLSTKEYINNFLSVFQEHKHNYFLISKIYKIPISKLVNEIERVIEKGVDLKRMELFFEFLLLIFFCRRIFMCIFEFLKN